MWVFIIIGLISIFIGLAVHVFKWYFLISGYNTMSKEKKKNVDTEGLGRLLGIYSYLIGALLIITGIVYELGYTGIVTPVIILVVILAVLMIVKSQKFDGNLYDEDGKFRKGAGKQLVPTMIITGITLIFVAVIMFFSSQSTEITILEDGIQIHGMYGDTYEWEEIETIVLQEALPTIERRTNGSALGPNLKGHFKTKEHGSVKLFVHKETPPFIYLKTKDKLIIFNMKEANETEAIFKQMTKE